MSHLDDSSLKSRPKANNNPEPNTGYMCNKCWLNVSVPWSERQAHLPASFWTSVLSCSVVTPWTVARQAPQAMGLYRRGYWSRLPFPSPGDLPHPGIKLASPGSPALTGGFFTAEPPGKPSTVYRSRLISQFVPPSPLPTMSTSPFSVSVSPFLPCR